MVELSLVLGGAIGAVAVGAAAAHLNGPIQIDWRARNGVMMRRLVGFAVDEPRRGGRTSCLILLTAILSGGALTAYGAAPPASAPDRLASEVAGVIGSGDQLGLRIKAPEGERTLRVGQVYSDGWTLQALTPTQATLVKDGTTREVGLNPTGAVASNAPTAPPSKITMVGLLSEAVIQAYIDKNPAMFAQMMAQVKGLTNEEARRYFAEIAAVQDEATRRQGAGETLGTLDMTTLRSVLGDEAAGDYVANRAKGNTAILTQQIADLQTRPFSGPNSYYVPAGANAAQIATAQGIDTRGGWANSAPDAQGGVTRTRTAQTAAEVAAGLAQTLATNPSGIPGAGVQRAP